MKTAVLMLCLSLSTFAQASFGGVFVGVDRSAPVTRFFDRMELQDFRASVTAMVIVKENNRKFNLAFTLSQPFANRPPNLRIGISTRIF